VRGDVVGEAGVQPRGGKAGLALDDPGSSVEQKHEDGKMQAQQQSALVSRLERENEADNDKADSKVVPM